VSGSVRTPLTYYGGKQKLAAQIVELMLTSAEFVAAVKKNLPPAVRPSTINLSMLYQEALDRADRAESQLDAVVGALERITTESVDITTPLKTLHALDQLRAIARAALSDQPEEEKDG
jgi:hypothetical protein